MDTGLDLFPLILRRIYGVRHWQDAYPDCKVHGANMGPIWGREGPGGPHVGPMNFAA